MLCRNVWSLHIIRYVVQVFQYKCKYNQQVTNPITNINLITIPCTSLVHLVRLVRLPVCYYSTKDNYPMTGYKDRSIYNAKIKATWLEMPEDMSDTQ